MDKGLVYYTDNRCKERILIVCQEQLKRCMKLYGYPIISVSHYPIDFGTNFVLNHPRGIISIYKQTIKGLEECPTDIIFLVEHDVLYHPSHFNATPSREDVFCFDVNKWYVSAATGQALTYYGSDESLMCAYRELLLRHFHKALEQEEKYGHDRSLGFTPPKGVPVKDRIGGVESYKAAFPSIHINHSRNFTYKRMKREQFRQQPKDWMEADEIPGWGKTKGRFNEFLNDIGRSDQPKEVS